MICQDWRDVAAQEIASLFEAEGRRWLERLGWDTAESWAVVEEGRAAGRVPGWILRAPGGRVLGWTYYLLHDGVLQIGGLSASRAAVARRLLDAILGSPEADLARSLSCFLFPDCPGTASAFARQRFRTRETLYLAAPTAADPADVDPAGAAIRPWRSTDFAEAARLLAAAYNGVPGSSCFAPDGRPQQWAHYAAQLLQSPACGRFEASLSFVAVSPETGEMMGLVLGSRLSADTAHVTQVAVAPAWRRRGLGDLLVGRVLSAAAARGYSNLTLMVDAGNQPARALYTRRGFVPRGSFLYGSRPARTRVVAA